MRNAVVFVAVLAASGCVTTTNGSGAAPGAAELSWVREHASHDMHLVASAGGEATGIALEAASPTDIRFKLPAAQVVPLGDVQRVTVVDRPLGALEGAMIGAAAGGLLGITVGFSQPLSPYEMSMDCT